MDLPLAKSLSSGPVAEEGHIPEDRAIVNSQNTFGKGPDSRSVSLISRQLAAIESQMTPSSRAPMEVTLSGSAQTKVTPSSPAPAVSKPPEISQGDGVHEEPLIQPETTSHRPSLFHRLWNATKQLFHELLAKLYAGWRRLPDTPDDQVDGDVESAEQGEQGRASIPIPEAAGSPNDSEELTLYINSEFADYYRRTFCVRLGGYSYSMDDGVFTRIVLEGIRQHYADHELWLNPVFMYEARVYAWCEAEQQWNAVSYNRSGTRIGAGFRPHHHLLARGPKCAQVWLRWALG
ncbi:MAG: hypothetical protein Q9200_000696 [Gallowayella weberi]